MTLTKNEQSAAFRGQRKLPQLETLRLYVDFRAFRRYMYIGINRLPHWLKNSEGRECVHAIKRCIRHLSVISRSYKRDVKITRLDLFLEDWDMIYDSISFFYEVREISKHQRNVMLNWRADIEDQVSAFRAWLSNVRPGQDEVPAEFLTGAGVSSGPSSAEGVVNE